MDGNIKDTPPIIPVPRARGPAALGRNCRRMMPAAKERVDARRKRGPARLRQVARRRPSRSVRRSDRRLTDLLFHAPLDEGEGKAMPCRRSMVRSRSAKFGTGYAWTLAKESRKGVDRRPGARIELADAGDFEQDQPFSFGAWVKLTKRHGQTGAILARMDDGTTSAAGTSGSRTAGSATHIIHKWPDDALKVVAPAAAQAEQVAPRDRDLRRLGQGRRRRRSTSTAKPQPRRGRRRQSDEHDPDQGAVEDRPAEHESARGDSVALHDLRHLRPRVAGRRSHRTRRSRSRRRHRFASRRQASRQGRPTNCSTGGSASYDTRVSQPRRANSRRWSTKRPRSKRAARSPT